MDYYYVRILTSNLRCFDQLQVLFNLSDGKINPANEVFLHDRENASVRVFVSDQRPENITVKMKKFG